MVAFLFGWFLGKRFGFGNALAFGKAFWTQECAPVLVQCISRKEIRKVVREVGMLQMKEPDARMLCNDERLCTVGIIVFSSVRASMGKGKGGYTNENEQGGWSMEGYEYWVVVNIYSCRYRSSMVIVKKTELLHA